MKSPYTGQEIILLLTPVRDILITQEFGVNRVKKGFYASLGIPSDLHNGIDFLAKDGCPVIACHNGVVTWAGEDGTGGISVNLTSSQSGPGFYTVYYHLQACAVKVGDHVYAGQLVGYADNTGKSSGSHLHFGLKETMNGATINKGNGFLGAIDPAPYFVDRDWDKTPAFNRYGRKRDWAAYLNEVKVMIALRKYLRRAPAHEEINACTYGGWGREAVASPGMAYNWKYLTKTAFQQGKRPFE